MKTFITLTAVHGLKGKGHKIKEGVQFDADEKDPQIVALVANGGIKEYVPTPAPEKVDLGEGKPKK
ncbi:MAG: hypothetical protein KDB65_10655 [Calditrichaeota bacterium]|nr:hypothetical protein [Calditrichota bacterium]